MYILYTLNDHIFLQIHINQLRVHVLMVSFFAMDHLVGLITKNIMKTPLPQVNIIVFALFYTILHGHVKPYKSICFTLT